MNQLRTFQRTAATDIDRPVTLLEFASDGVVVPASRDTSASLLLSCIMLWIYIAISKFRADRAAFCLALLIRLRRFHLP